MRIPVDTIATLSSAANGATFKLGKDGEPANGLALPDLIVQVGGTFVGTIAFQGSLDGINWFDWFTTAVPVVLVVEKAPFRYRGACTAYTSGTATVSVQRFLQD